MKRMACFMMIMGALLTAKAQKDVSLDGEWLMTIEGKEMGEEGLGKWRIRRHGVTKVDLTPKASYHVLRQLMAPIDITEVLPANSMKSGDALAGQIVVDSSDHDARITLQVKNTIPSYTLRGYTLTYKDGNGQRQTIALPDMQPGMKHTLVLKNINAQYAFEIQRPNGYKVIEY